MHDVLSGRSIGRRARAKAEKPDVSLAVRFDIMNSIASDRRAPSKWSNETNLISDDYVRLGIIKINFLFLAGSKYLLPNPLSS